MKIKTAELTGPALDWAVAKCEGFTDEVERSGWAWYPSSFTPSTSWQEGGPIIEREGIALLPEYEWCGYIDNIRSQKYGPTPLIAAMRCFVASRLGDEVDVPEELK